MGIDYGAKFFIGIKIPLDNDLKGRLMQLINDGSVDEDWNDRLEQYSSKYFKKVSLQYFTCSLYNNGCESLIVSIDVPLDWLECGCRIVNYTLSLDSLALIPSIVSNDDVIREYNCLLCLIGLCPTEWPPKFLALVQLQ